MLADELRKSLNQPFLVENRVGAYGNIAAGHVAKASPDGYTLLVHNAAAVASSASAFKSLTFNPRTDFAPVAIVAHQPGVLVVNPALPVKSVQDFIDYARTKAGKLNYGVGGIFGPTHTPAVLFEMKTGIKAEAVMYKGAAPAIVDLVGGQIDFIPPPPRCRTSVPGGCGRSRSPRRSGWRAFRTCRRSARVAWPDTSSTAGSA